MSKEYTDNGIEYESWLAGPDGMSFTLRPIKEYHNAEDVLAARAQLKRDRDVVGMIRIEWQDSGTIKRSGK